MENQDLNVSKELLDRVQAAKALATAHSLLGVGMFQHRHQEALKQTLDFITSLHKQVLTDCLSHPDADKVQDLIDYKAEQSKQTDLEQLIKESMAKEQE